MNQIMVKIKELFTYTRHNRIDRKNGSIVYKNIFPLRLIYVRCITFQQILQILGKPPQLVTHVRDGVFNHHLHPSFSVSY